MPHTVNVLYKQGTKFDMAYYKATHMPLVMRCWGPLGLKGFRIIEYPAEAPYLVQAILEFDSLEDIQRAQSSDAAKEVLGDIPKFANPSDAVVLMAGEVKFTAADI